MLSASVVLGFMSFNKFKLKIDFLEQFAYLIKHTEIKIKYDEDLLFNIFSSFKTENKFLKKMLSALCNDLKNTSYFKDESFSCYKILNKINLLRDDELTIINNFIQNLGTSDVDNQIKLCKISEHSIKERLTVALNEKDKKSKVYFLLHVAVGLIFVIIFL